MLLALDWRASVVVATDSGRPSSPVSSALLGIAAASVFLKTNLDPIEDQVAHSSYTTLRHVLLI